MTHLFYAMSSVFIAHRLFSLIKPLNETILYLMVELAFVIWVFIGLFTSMWYMFLFLIICGQIGLTIEWFIKLQYIKGILNILTLVEIVLLSIITYLTI